MSDLFTIGTAGVNAYQRALSVVSNNIANVSTDGYSRQNVRLTANTMAQRGAIYFGTGARFESAQRQYDAFVESNLRNSQSAYSAKGPLLSYTNRVIDILGDESIGLTPAMNLFFESTRNLATDASSAVARGVLFRDADGLAARFREMASQIGLIDDETRQNLSTDIAQVNVYTDQLAFINSQLMRHETQAKQPAELLDQRDKLLSNLSELIDFNVTFDKSGQALVSIGDSINQGILVEHQYSRSIEVIDSPTEANKVAFLIDPYGDKETVASVGGGSVGGLIEFRDQVLNMATDAMDGLAEALVGAVNGYHNTGLDMNGEVGGDMFAIDASVGGAAGMQMILLGSDKIAASADFRVSDIETNLGSAQALVAYGDTSYGAVDVLTDTFETALSDDYLQSFTMTSTMPARLLGAVEAGQKDVVIYMDQPQAGQWLEVMTRDGQHLAGSVGNADAMVKASFGMEIGATYSDTYLNASTADSYMGMDVFVGAKATATELQQFDPNTGEILPPAIQPAEMLATQEAPTIEAFFSGWSGSNVFSLNGVMLEYPGASSAYTGNQGLADWIGSYESLTGVSASIEDGALKLTNALATAQSDLGYTKTQRTIAEGDVMLEGYAMPALSSDYTLDDVVDWLNTGPSAGSLSFNAAVINGSLALVDSDGAELSDNTSTEALAYVRSALGIVSGFDTTKTINGTPMNAYSVDGVDRNPADMTFTDVINWVNQGDNVSNTSITAFADEGHIALALGTLTSVDDIRLGFTRVGSELAGGTPSDLASLGFRTGAYITGRSEDDLVVAVSDYSLSAGTYSTVDAMVSYADPGMADDARQMWRQRDLSIEFYDDNGTLRYSINDQTNGASSKQLLADREFAAGQTSIDFRGLTVEFSSMPQAKDQFLIDGNQGGLGNNEVMLKIASIEDDATILGTGLTITETYIENVNDVGSIARQAGIAQSALQVVKEQAEQAKDAVSGVSLDEEAADLVRFQQAYQANAKVMQVASTLFDAILAVR